MAFLIQPLPAPRAPFRRLVRDENTTAMIRDRALDEGGGALIRVPENLRYLRARMNIADMAVLLDTAAIPPLPGSAMPYEDAQPAIDQYTFDFIGTMPSRMPGGGAVSRQA